MVCIHPSSHIMFCRALTALSCQVIFICISVTFEAAKATYVLCHMKCLVCKDTSCCYQLCCEKCYPTPPDHRCNACRMPHQIQVIGVPRSIIGNLPTVCLHNGCNTTTRRSELPNYEEKFEYRIKYCTSNRCQKVGSDAAHIYYAPRRGLAQLEALSM